MRPRRLLAFGAALALLAPPIARAADAPAAPIAALAAALTDQTGGFKARYDALAPVVGRALDIATILRNSVGLKWSTLPPDQQQALLAVFTKFTIASYVANFGPGDKVELVAGERTLGADVAVPTRIVPKSGDPTRVDYLMHDNGAAGWQATDVLLDGSISRVAVQRSDFRSELKDPAGASRLIADLGRKVTSLSGGTVAP